MKKSTEWHIDTCVCVRRHSDGYLSMLNALFLFIGKWSPRDVRSFCGSPWRPQL